LTGLIVHLGTKILQKYLPKGEDREIELLLEMGIPFLFNYAVSTIIAQSTAAVNVRSDILTFGATIQENLIT